MNCYLDWSFRCPTVFRLSMLYFFDTRSTPVLRIVSLFSDIGLCLYATWALSGRILSVAQVEYEVSLQDQLVRVLDENVVRLLTEKVQIEWLIDERNTLAHAILPDIKGRDGACIYTIDSLSPAQQIQQRRQFITSKRRSSNGSCPKETYKFSRLAMNDFQYKYIGKDKVVLRNDAQLTDRM